MLCISNITAAMLALSLAISTLITADDYAYAQECQPLVCFDDESCGQWSGSVDFLWWRADEEGLALGKEVVISRSGLDPLDGIYDDVSKDSQEKDLNFKFDPGFRLGLAYTDADECWNVSLDWTHFHTSAQASGGSNLADPASDTYAAFQSDWEALSKNFPLIAHGKWTLSMDIIDFEVGRNFDLSSHFACRPYFGLRGARIDQGYRTHSHNDVSGNFNGSSYHYTSQTKATCNFLGGGPLAGLDAEFRVGYGFSFFGQIAAALLFGRFDRHAHEHFENSDHYYYLFNHYDDHVRGSGKDSASRACTDLTVGFEWKHCVEWCQQAYPVAIALSWEHHAFYNFNNFNFESNGFTNTDAGTFDFGPYANLLSTKKRHGDLFTQGITLSADIGF